MEVHVCSGRFLWEVSKHLSPIITSLHRRTSLRSGCQLWCGVFSRRWRRTGSTGGFWPKSAQTEIKKNAQVPQLPGSELACPAPSLRGACYDVPQRGRCSQQLLLLKTTALRKAL